MKLKMNWVEFLSFTIEGMRNRGYDTISLPMFLWKQGDPIPEAVEIEINKRKLPYEISGF